MTATRDLPGRRGAHGEESAAGLGLADRLLAARSGSEQPVRLRAEQPVRLRAEEVDDARSTGDGRGADSDRTSADADPDPSGEPPEPLNWRPPPTLRQRLSRAVSVPALTGAVVFVAAVVIAIVVVMAKPHDPLGAALDADRAAASLSEGGSAATGVDSDSGDTADATGTSRGANTGDPTGEVFVHVVGEVNDPGVYELPADARVEAAIDAAGGTTPEAVLSGVNLARVVADGEQILVPDAETAAAAAAGTAPGAAPGGGPGASSEAEAGVGGAATDTGLVNLNTADAAALETLPRVGPALAQRIIDWRGANGGFASVDQLLEVSGIGVKTLEGLRDRVAV